MFATYSTWSVAITAGVFIPIVVFLFRSSYSTPSSSSAETAPVEKKPAKSIMQPARTDLAPPKDDKFTLESLKEFNGLTPDKPIYVSIKGTVFDVSHKKETYGPGGSYGLFAGKDASMGLGKSSLKEEHALPDYSALPENELKVLNDWYDFFKKRYNIVGVVVDHPNGIVPV